MAFSCNSLQLNDHIILNVSVRGNNIVTVLLERLLFPHENGTPIELRTLRFIFVFGLTNASFTPVWSYFFGVALLFARQRERTIRKYLQPINQLTGLQLFSFVRI